MTPRTHLGPLQQAIMDIVWASEEVTVNQARDQLNREVPYAYTTVLSAMQKLEKQGWLRHRSQGRVYVYRAKQTRAQSERHTLGKLLDVVFAGDAFLMFQRLVEHENLTSEDLAELESKIREYRNNRSGDEG